MDNNNTVCPVCTLYLRTGITLKSHLATHPKQKVIEALVRLAGEKPSEECTAEPTPCSTVNMGTANQQPSTNHAFIYQQFMSSTGPQPVVINPMNQQFATINMFNPQTMFSPQVLNPYYLQQQQFQIVSATSNIQPFAPNQNPAICAPEVFTTSVDTTANLDNFDNNVCSVVRNLPEEVGNSSVSRDDCVIVDHSSVASQATDTNEFETNEGTNRTTSVISKYSPDLSGLGEIHENVPQESEEGSSRTFENSIDSENAISVISSNKSEYILPNNYNPTEPERVEGVECIEIDDDSQPELLVNVQGKLLIVQSSQEKAIGVDDDDLKNYYNRNEDEEDVSETLNIKSDEKMPPRGELSEQESNGASDIGWGGRLCQEGSSRMSSTDDLLARESWDASDCSDTQMPPFLDKLEKDEVDLDDDDSDNSFNCSIYDLSFSPKECEASDETSPKKIKARLVSSKDAVEDNEESKAVAIKEETKETQPETQLKPVFDESDMKDVALCSICGEMLPSLKDLTIHIRKEHKVNDFRHKCKTCGEAFESETKFSLHLKEHPLECNICGKYFFRVPNLKLHLKRHMGIKPFKCNICSKAFITKQKLCEHINVHTGKLPINCNLCDHKFRRHSNLIQHRNRHHSKTKKRTKDFICHCGEIFHSKCKLSWHKETHELKPKSCFYCLEKFIHAASLTRHIRRAHNDRYVPKVERDGENVECNVCKRTYLKSSLDSHLATHSGKKQFQCNLCSKILTTRWNLKMHKWTHAASNSKPYKCEHCDTSFLREAEYISHVNSHKSVRPYTCNYCGCKFIRKYNCLRHVREHEKDKSFKCSECDKTFHRSYYLKEHMRVHNGVRPFSCEICGKTSTTKSNHNKHLKIHHAREPINTEG